MVAGESVGIPEAARRVVASILVLELVLALLLADGVVVAGNSAHVVGEAEILDLSPDVLRILSEVVRIAVVAALLHTLVPHAVLVTVAGGEVGVLEAAAEVADGEGGAGSVVVAAAVGSGAFSAVHLSALQDASVLEPIAFIRSAAFSGGGLLLAIAATDSSEVVPEASRCRGASERSVSSELALEGALESCGAELADIAVGLADERIADARASSDAESADGIDGAARRVEFAGLEVVLVFHLAGFDALSRDTDPFASTTIVTEIDGRNAIALLDADASDVVPGTRGVGRAICGICPAVLALVDTRTTPSAHAVGGAESSGADAGAIGVATRADEVPGATASGVAFAGEFVPVQGLASLEAEVLVGNGGAVGPLFAHRVRVAGRLAREQVAVGNAERLTSVPHALIVVVTVDRGDVTELAEFLAGLGAVVQARGCELTLVVSGTDTERAEVASHAALVLDGVPLADIRVAITSGSASVASGAASLGVGFPEAVVVVGAARFRVVQVFATLCAGLVGAPSAHEDTLAWSLGSDETASLAAANITFIEHAARVQGARVHVGVLEFALDVAGAETGRVPHAETIGGASRFGALGRATELTFEVVGVPRAFDVSDASGLCLVGVLTLSLADTGGRRPHAHGGGVARVAREVEARSTATEHEGVPHTGSVGIARRLEEVLVTASLLALS